MFIKTKFKRNTNSHNDYFNLYSAERKLKKFEAKWAKFVRSNFFHILNIYRFHYKQRNVIKHKHVKQ